MPARPSIDGRLRRVRGLRDESDHAALRAAVSKSLTDSSNLVVAEAAKIVGDMQLSGFEPELLRTFERLLIDPIKSDKGCRGKSAVVEALNRLEFDDVEFFLRGMNYEQVEPAWPSSEDAAVAVRGGCAFGLAASRQVRAVTKLTNLVDLLQRPGRLDRIHAVQAIAQCGGEPAIPLLRLKLLSGDAEAEVIGACMAGLLRLAPAESFAIVVRHLDSPDESTVIEAAAALGECGNPEAVEALIARAGRNRDRELLEPLLASIGLSRAPRAIDYLISRIAADESEAEIALRALRPACVYAETRERVKAAVEKTGNPRLSVKRHSEP